MLRDFEFASGADTESGIRRLHSSLEVEHRNWHRFMHGNDQMET